MIAKEFAEIIMNDWLDDCELVVEVDGKQYAAKKVETDEVNGRCVCILVAENEGGIANDSRTSEMVG